MPKKTSLPQVGRLNKASCEKLNEQGGRGLQNDLEGQHGGVAPGGIPAFKKSCDRGIGVR